ncbi:SET domain-containing protein-lysine N-methyltransferase [Parasediminibacterium sp. JCM 36343]|uniref:SET domain-containing protein-lysine N-methyltransferase n=1 Tax=Parasediminibacterium sp. JCM 36343 TaxID=3374279 RepID=UPI00397D48CD
MLTLEKKYKVVSTHGFAEIVLDTVTNQQSLFTKKAFAANEDIISFRAAKVVQQPSYLTVQTGIGKHIILEPVFLQYINHSCEPNVFFDTTAMQLVCIKPIEQGDELRFFYPSSEWEMETPFVCNCGTPSCLGLIQGASFLSNEITAKYRFTDFIKKQLQERK